MENFGQSVLFRTNAHLPFQIEWHGEVVVSTLTWEVMNANRTEQMNGEDDSCWHFHLFHKTWPTTHMCSCHCWIAQLVLNRHLLLSSIQAACGAWRPTSISFYRFNVRLICGHHIHQKWTNFYEWNQIAKQNHFKWQNVLRRLLADEWVCRRCTAKCTLRKLRYEENRSST